MAEAFWPSREGTSWLVLQAQFVDVTKPGDAYQAVAPTGKRRGLLCGMVVPAWLVYGLWRILRPLRARWMRG